MVFHENYSNTLELPFRAVVFHESFPQLSALEILKPVLKIPIGNSGLRKVVFSSQSCDDCYDDILSVTLHGAPNHGHKGYECMFEQNPQPFYNDSKITFDNAAELGECWEVNPFLNSILDPEY